MFTGLIQDVGTVLGIQASARDAEITLSTALDNLVLGESIAIMGACLSVTQHSPRQFQVFASEETLSKTGVGDLKVGQQVNLERALRLSDALGGHLVSGHVDTRVRCLSRTPAGEAVKFSFAMPEEPLASQIAPKGSVTIDGISLTVNDVTSDQFDVMIIPITQAHTSLSSLQPGDLINLETDLIAKYVARLLGSQNAPADKGGVDLELLYKSGFVR